ncbi:MAG: hypothetical protein KGZ58_08655 [Ignavibacteriales bacterium]|nr:hypothetical protein [Ignavibacteriales bacterium]
MTKIILIFIFIISTISFSQVKPKVSLVGGDEAPQLKPQIQSTLETVLLQMNRLQKGTGDITSLKKYFSENALQTFEQFVVQNKAYTARKEYSPSMIQRKIPAQIPLNPPLGKGEYYYDVRSITVKVNLGETEASDNQSLVFTFSQNGIIVSVRAILPNYDYQNVLQNGTSAIDTAMRLKILDFLEQFRMAYNTKNNEFLEKVYSDDALILVGTVLKEKENGDFASYSKLSQSKLKMVQKTKQDYLSDLKNKAFKNNSFIAVRFDSIKILQHEKNPELYGISCWQEWKSSNYTDRGFLFLMMDFHNIEEPIIHVRAWQPKAFEEDDSFVSIYDFDVVGMK